MKTTLRTCCVIAFFLVTCTNAQRIQNIDSIIEVTKTMPDDSLKVGYYSIIYENLMFSNPEKSYDFAKKEYALSKKINYGKGIASSQLHFADYFKDRGKLDSARYYYKKSREKFENLNNILGILFVNHSMASFEQSQGNYKKALDYANKNINLYKGRDTIKTEYGKSFNLIGAEYELIGGIHVELGNYNIALKETQKALHFFEEKKDTIREGDALMALGNIESLLGNPKKAVNYYQKSYSIYNHFNDQQYLAYSAINIGQNFVELEKLLDAEKYFNEALEIAKKIENKSLEGDALIYLSGLYRRLDQNKEALNIGQKALSIHTQLDYKKSISTDLIELTKIKLKDNELLKAIEYINQSINIATKIEAKDNLSESLELRSRIHKKMKEFSMALSDFEMFKSVNDSIFNKSKSQQIEELRTIYDTEKKEQQIALQENEINLLEQKEKNSTLQKILMSVGLLLSLLGFYALRQKLKRNKLEKEKLNAELAFKKKELTTHALHLAKKNETLENLKQKAEELKASENTSGYQQLIRTINFDLQDDNNWKNFTRYFEEVHKDFNSNVKSKYPEVTFNELRLMALLKMNLTSKEIANILNISQEGIKKARYRLRKKLNITSEDSLQDLVINL